MTHCYMDLIRNIGQACLQECHTIDFIYYCLNWHGGEKCGEPLGSPKNSPVIASGRSWFHPISTQAKIHTLEMIPKSMIFSGCHTMFFCFVFFFVFFLPIIPGDQAIGIFI